MTDQTGKKKMSKGCLIGLIVGGVFVAMVAVAAITCYMKKDDIARYGISALIESIKTRVNAGEIEGVDAERFTLMADAFKVKLEAEPLDYTKFQRFAQSIQSLADVEGADKEGINSLMAAMVEYFPELEEFSPPDESADSSMAEDSTALTDSTAAQ